MMFGDDEHNHFYYAQRVMLSEDQFDVLADSKRSCGGALAEVAAVTATLLSLGIRV